MATDDFFRVDPQAILDEKDRARKAALMQYLAQQCRVDVFVNYPENGKEQE